jgi:hypothetical protein
LLRDAAGHLRMLHCTPAPTTSTHAHTRTRTHDAGRQAADAHKLIARCSWAGKRQTLIIKNIVWPILAALRDMHRVGIVHRDIKPANLLINEDSGTPVKLIDLGAAVDLRTGVNFNPETGLLDPKYAPPEQLVVPQEVGPCLPPSPTCLKGAAAAAAAAAAARARISQAAWPARAYLVHSRTRPISCTREPAASAIIFPICVLTQKRRLPRCRVRPRGSWP